MLDDNCIFCKIVEGKLPAVKIWEDDEHVAILDLYPRVEGQTLVITKEHFDSYAFDLPDDVFEKLLMAAKKIGKTLDKALGAEKTVMITEGYGVNHVHVKLYPNPPGGYEGFTTTALGQKATVESLEEVAKKIREAI